MRLGVFGGDGAPDEAIAAARQAEDDGFSSFWFPNILGYDAMTIAAVVAREAPSLELGTSVVPTFARHPMTMAQQALTVSALAPAGFVLGIGLSHQVVVEGMWRMSYSSPLRHMREYLDVLMPLLRGEAARVDGTDYSMHGGLTISDPPTPSVMLAALGPKMLELAGTVADGTITWMTGQATLRNHIVPAITDAAAAAGRPQPRISAGIPVCVTDDPAAARQRAEQVFAIYGHLPSYRAMLDREGAAGPGDVAIVGDEDRVGESLRDLAAAGVTDLSAVEFGADPDERDRTRALLRSLL